jgi:hypothetical protein
MICHIEKSGRSLLENYQLVLNIPNPNLQINCFS